MSEAKKILIIGGGYGGVWAGKILEKHFRKNQNIEITLVDSRSFHTLMTELHEVAGWRTEPESVQVSFRKIFATKRINVVQDTIKAVDFEAKKATGTLANYDFDFCVIGAGAEPEFFGIPGIKENSFSLWSFEDAMKIRNHVEHIFYAASKELDPAARKRMLTFVVAGAGFTGIEMIGELLELRDVMCRKYYMDPKDVQVINIEALPSILPILEEPLRAKAEKYLAKKGCKVMLGQAIVGAEPGKVLLKSGEIVETDTFIWTCGVKGSSFAGSLALPMGKRNRIDCDEGMRSTQYPNVYVVGDNAGLMVNGKPMAQVVESAHFSAEAAAKNIIADIEGGERHVFKPNYHGFMVSIGGRYGVANAGGIKSSGFVAMFFKHFINMFYLFNIAGINQVWEYFKHEFLDMKNKRTFVGGFISHNMRFYWVLLLRMWLGLMWVFEGVNKIGEGWLNFAKGTSSGWMFSPGVVQKGVEVADAASAASGAWEAAAEPAAEAVTAASGAWDAAAEVTATTIADAASAASGAWDAAAEVATEAVTAASGAWEAAGDAAAETAGRVFKVVWDLAKPIFNPQSGIVTWFRTTFMDGIFAYLPFSLFQVMIVAMEIAIGLALFGGCFTWLAAVASIGMCVIFTMSGMFAWNQLWFVFAAIVMMGGAGRAFGLDYWVVPFFKKWWNGTRFARKWHFYADDPSK
ncbi:MAG: NAD(P)/FAD-dependent oxidoreductase [Spirochaetia bacterium]|jgi:NADH dehydrogenase|nr:NAD(P)/FAD-dependent oxidoreductase [Spirochaetales bacterium]MDX9784110.1 NAD(P)/FAD-dependent oxidoreductase [Spirochaetia bacterium]